MPRGKGGSRQGTAGTAYGNRTDLNLPKTTVPNQEYGKATEQREAQSAVPMGSSPVSSAPLQQAPAAPVPAPGTLPHLEPTNRPNEPVTTGLPFGPGAGPEAIAPNYASFGDSLRTAAGSGSATALSLMLADSAKSLGL